LQALFHRQQADGRKRLKPVIGPKSFNVFHVTVLKREEKSGSSAPTSTPRVCSAIAASEPRPQPTVVS